MLFKRFSTFILTATVAAAGIAPLAPVYSAPVASRQKRAAIKTDAPDQAARLAAVERAIDEKRKQLNIPGISLVIVKDDKAIYSKGLGLKDLERNQAVTPDTVFAIGSNSKAFTALAALVSADEGKMSLDDSPKKYLPYFKLQDPDADARVTIRDLLSHQTGLGGTDLAWYTGVLNREEVIRTACLAKPTAKLREKFQYQNVMYSAAGEAVAKAQNSTWEDVIATRFFKPLGMKSSNTSVKEMQKSSDFATGYQVSNTTPSRLPLRDLTNIAPAGAINSTARDMAEWLRFLLAGGVYNGKRLVSEKGFNEWITKQVAATGASGYALGWAVADWRGHKVLMHTGGIDGFHSLVAWMPDQKLGFVMLTNVSESPIMGTALNAVWTNLVGGESAAAQQASQTKEPGQVKEVEPKDEVGSYDFVEAAMVIEVVLKDGKLVAIVPGQPNYPLVKVSGRRYKLGDPAPDGFFITFRPVTGREGATEAYLEQPQGNYVLPKLTADEVARRKSEAENYSGPLKEMIGEYVRDNVRIEVTLKNGKVALVVPGQPPYPLTEKEKDVLSPGGLPETYKVIVKRDASGKVSAILLKQPEGEFEFKRAGDGKPQTDEMSVEELMKKVAEAEGGEANLKRHVSMVTTAELMFENQGTAGELTFSAKAPSAFESSLSFIALGKKIATIREYFDGRHGGVETSFSPAKPFDGKQLDHAKVDADFHKTLNWKTLYKEVKLKGRAKVGDEDVYVVVKTPEKGNPETDYVSTKTFLVVKRDKTVDVAGQGDAPVSELYSDYRMVDGVMVPFKVVAEQPGLGRVISLVKDVKFNVALTEAEFRPRMK